MSQISISINGRDYTIACDDGQEEHLRFLSDYLDTRMGQVVENVGQVGDARLLVILALMLADELSDTTKERTTSASGDNKKGSIAGVGAQEINDADINAIEILADQIETIAGRLEGS